MEENPTPNSSNNNQDYEQLLMYKPYPTLSQSWGLFGMFLVFSLAVGFFVGMVSAIPGAKESSWLSLFSYVVQFGLLLLFINQALKTRRQPLALHFKQQPILLYLILLFITPALSFVCEPLMSWLPMPEFLEKVFEQLLKLDTATFISIVIAAPICEEVICRGIILEGLLKNRMKPTSAIMMSALIFATLHLNPWQGVMAFVLGSLMGWVYYKTRSLLPCIFIHFVNNGLAFLMLFIYKDSNIDVDTPTTEVIGENYIWIYVNALVLVGLLGYCLYVYFKRKPQPEY